MIKVITRNVIEDENSDNFYVYANRATRQIMHVREFGSTPILKFFLGSQAIPLSVPVVIRQARQIYRNVEGVMFGNTLDNALQNYLAGKQNFRQCNENIYRFFAGFCSGELYAKISERTISIPQNLYCGEEMSVSERFIYFQRHNAVPDKLVELEEIYTVELPVYHELKNDLNCELQHGE